MNFIKIYWQKKESSSMTNYLTPSDENRTFVTSQLIHKGTIQKWIERKEITRQILETECLPDLAEYPISSNEASQRNHSFL